MRQVLHLLGVRSIRSILAVLLAILWLPATAHCLLIESANGLNFLSCCTHTETSTLPDHHENECATDSCSVVESAQYKSSIQRLTLPPPTTVVMFELPLPLTIGWEAFTAASQRTDQPLKLSAGWQFSARTALAPRAPSLCS